jgi:branched-chain amino acid transport system ATP-binding protein
MKASRSAVPSMGDVCSGALRADRITAGYHGRPVISELDFEVSSGEIVALLGANGAGKTTTLRAVSGQIPLLGGELTINGIRPDRAFHRRVRAGLGVLPERRCLAMALTAAENLRLGRGSTEAALRYFPELERKLGTKAGLLSGGEQQMLSLARILAIEPRIVLADEVSLGLAPKIVARLLSALSESARQGAAVLIVEQHVRLALRVADRAYVLRRGQVVLSGTGSELQSDAQRLSDAYL